MSKRTIGWLAAACFLLTAPLLAQGTGSVPPGTDEAPDPGFAHNHVGRNIGDPGGLPDYGNYCGPMPSHICHGPSYHYVVRRDAFYPQFWTTHRGNAFAVRMNAKKGWPLQTVTVTDTDGQPLEYALVRFFEPGYAHRGVIGRTGKDGKFQIAVKRNKRSHRFLVEADGLGETQLDIVGREFGNDQHLVVLGSSEPRREEIVRVAVVGDTAVPERLSRDYRRAQKDLAKGNYQRAIPALKALVERWPLGELEDGGEYQPRTLLSEALIAVGERELAEQVAAQQVELVETAG